MAKSRKKKIKVPRMKDESSNTRPWDRIYAQLNVAQILVGVIPKRLRSIDAAKERLKIAKTLKAADVERRLLDRSLKAINGAYSTIRKAMHKNGDMQRWTEFPSLEATVKQVDNISWADLQGLDIPGNPINYDIPKFDDGSTVSNVKVIKSDNLATGPANNGETAQKNIKEEVEVELEEGEIKEEMDDEPGVPLDIAPRKQPPPPESVTPNQPLRPPPHEDGHPYQADFGHYFPGLPFQWMPHQDDQPSTNAYSFMPYFPVASLPSATYGSGRQGGADQRIPHGAIYPQPHPFPQQPAVRKLPGASSRASTSPLSQPPPSLTSSSLTLPSEPSPSTKPPSASPVSSAEAKEHDGQQREKRKSSILMDLSTSGPRCRPKRRRPVASDFMSDSEDNEDNQNKNALPASGVPDFGAWFQKQVTCSKKKHSHSEHTSLRIENSKGT